MPHAQPLPNPRTITPHPTHHAATSTLPQPAPRLGDAPQPSRPSIRSFYAAAWHGFWPNILTLFALALTAVGGYVILGFVQQAARQASITNEATNLALGLCGQVWVTIGCLAFLKGTLDIAHTGKANLFSSFRGYSIPWAILLFWLGLFVTLTGVGFPIVGNAFFGSIMMLALPACVHDNKSLLAALKESWQVVRDDVFGYVRLWFATAFVAKLIVSCLVFGLLISSALLTENADTGVSLLLVGVPLVAFPFVSLVAIGACHTYLCAAQERCHYRADNNS